MKAECASDFPHFSSYFYPGLGEFEESVTHLTNAIAVSGQPQQLLQLFKQTLPPDVFKMLMTSLSAATASTSQVCYLVAGKLCQEFLP